MNRRQFIKITAGAAGIAAFQGFGHLKQGLAAPKSAPHQQFDSYFLKLLDGFLINARRTNPDYVVCDYPDGTKLKSCCTPSGKSYVSVARMVPAIAEWIAARGPSVPGSDVNLIDVLVSIYRNAFDPKYPDFWGLARSDKPTQLSVEAALIASTLCREGEPLLSKLSSADRANIQNWLASCTQVPERATNHAWFSAINHAARLELSRTYPEFKGDEKWMLDDLRALDGLFPANNDGWYSDDPTIPIYDYYNFWVFANFPIFWSRIIGKRYPEWKNKFQERIKIFLQNTPYFFSATGLHPLFGRSLIYRWALLSPLVLGYEQGFWPHSPGLLRRIVRKSLEVHFALGAFDDQRGKLRETYTPDGTPDVKEAYVDNGHPYWAMQVFTMFAIPPADAFWSAQEELLPIEKADFAVRFAGPRMIVVGNKESGQVKWVQARNIAKKPYYRDKYDKFAYSSHFPFNVVIDKKPTGPADQVLPIDQALVFCSNDGIKTSGRTGVKDGTLLDDGVETQWWSELGELRFDVVSRIHLLSDDFEYHEHEISVPDAAIAQGMYVLGGSYAVGLEKDEKPTLPNGGDLKTVWVKSEKSGALVMMWPMVRNYGGGENIIEGTNILKSRSCIAYVQVPLKQKTERAAWLIYASTKPMDQKAIEQKASELIAKFQPADAR